MKPEYGMVIIVGVNYREQFSWYVSEKELWFLDLGKLRRDFGSISTPEDTFEWRFNLPIVDESTADEFLLHMARFRATTEQLRSEVIEQYPFTSWDDTIEFCPSLFVDFDRKHLCSLFPEPASFEHYVPDGWSGDFSDFLVQIPSNERYWVVDGVDQFSPFFVR